MKIGIVGAGSVGSNLAMRIAETSMAQVALVDTAEGLAEGRAIDIQDSSGIIGFNTKVTGSGDFADLRDSGIVAITAGFPRKPGMSRENLVQKNKKIIEDVIENIKKYSPDAIVLVVTNPLDAMAYLAYKKSGIGPNRVIGMAGTLDTARFANLLANEIGCPPKDIKTYVLGSHGDTMVPILSKTFVGKRLLKDLLPEDKIKSMVDRVKNRGSEVVGLLKTGSASYSPGAGSFQVIQAIVNDTKETLCVSAYLDGEYGLKDIFIGVPAKIGKNGVEKIIEIDLDKNETALLSKSAAIIRETITQMSADNIHR